MTQSSFTRVSLRENLFFFGAAVVGALFIAVSSSKSLTSNSKPKTFLYPPSDSKYFTLGYRELAADLLWIRVIQDFDICDQSSAALSAPELPPAFTGISPAGVERKPSRCDKGWVYQMINQVTELAPRFRQPYESGATMLSIVVDDREGAFDIYKKGVKQFPERWELHYRLGYHYLYEMHDIPGAAEEMKKAAELGAPDWTYALAGRLYSKAGQAELGISILEEALAKDPEGPGSHRIRERLALLKSELSKVQAAETPN